MKLIVTARDHWRETPLQKVFGELGSVYYFPDTTYEFLKFVSQFGRFEIKFPESKNEIPEIEFHNGYD